MKLKTWEKLEREGRGGRGGTGMGMGKGTGGEGGREGGGEEGGREGGRDLHSYVTIEVVYIDPKGKGVKVRSCMMHSCC